MYEDDFREVDYATYCNKCKHKKLEETDSPCDECLENPVNQYTNKPVRYEEAE